MNNRLFSRNDLVRLIIPLIVDQFLQVAVGLSDSIMVARVGEAAVSGVSLVDTVMLLIINIFTALATGGAVIAGQYLGRKDPKTGCEATAQLFNFTFLFSIFIMILGYLGQNVILYHVFGKIEPEVMKDSRTYLLIVLSSIPMIAMYDLPRHGKFQCRDEDLTSHELHQRIRKRAFDLRISPRCRGRCDPDGRVPGCCLRGDSYFVKQPGT